MHDIYFTNATFSEDINRSTKILLTSYLANQKAANTVLGATDKIDRKIQTFGIGLF